MQVLYRTRNKPEVFIKIRPEPDPKNSHRFTMLKQGIAYSLNYCNISCTTGRSMVTTSLPSDGCKDVKIINFFAILAVFYKIFSRHPEKLRVP